MKIISALAAIAVLSISLTAQTEGAITSNPVIPIYTTTGFPHFLSLDWTPDMGDINSLTGTMTIMGATPGASGIIVASLGQTDELAYGFLPILVDVNPINISAYAYFGYDAMGSLVIPNISRQMPALVGMNMYIQAFEYSPLATSSNGLRFDLAP